MSDDRYMVRIECFVGDKEALYVAALKHAVEVRRRVERLLPGPYLELFARKRAPGWDAWGDQVEVLDRETNDA